MKCKGSDLMDKINQEQDNLNRIIKMIAAQFGENCEVVLHDLTKGYDQTIIAIENNHVTKRNIGDSGTNLGLELLRGTVESGDRYNYFTKTKDGKILRSSTLYLKNEEGAVTGCICVNQDLTDYLHMEKLLNGITNSSDQNIRSEVDEVFVNDVNELLDHLIKGSQELVRKTPDEMTREDRMVVIKFLDSKGAFLITRAGDRVCEYLNISKFTLYNYLDIIKKKGLLE